MKEYPFCELDYLIRENGTGPFLDYVREPDDANLEMLQAGVPQRKQHDIDGHFWDVLSRIVHSDGDPLDKIQHVFNYCFELAFYRIKDHWYDPKANDGHRRFLREQFTHSIGESTQAILDKREWQDYRQQYTTACDHFVSRLERNLSGYKSVEEARRLDDPIPVAREESFQLRVEAKTFRNHTVVTDRVYERVINQLFDELTQQGLIGATVKRDFTGLFLGTFYQKINWLGTFQQLKYLIDGLVDLGLISGKNKWLIAVDCFTKDGDLIHTNQLKDTSRLKREDRDTLSRMLIVIRELMPKR